MAIRNTHIRKPGQRRFTTILLVVFFTILGAIVLIPFISIVFTSLKDSGQVIRNGFNLSIDAKSFTWANYIYVFTQDHTFFRWFGNSLYLAIVQTVLTLFISAWVGYGFALYEFKGKTALFVCVLLVMMTPFEILMLPLFREIIALNLTNTYWGIMLPYLAHPIAIFFFMQFMKGIPREIVDSGRIDGCSEYGIFIRLILPMIKPALAAMAIFIGMNSWNNYLWPLLVLKDSVKFTLPIGLNSLMGPYGNNYKVLVAGSVLSIVPIVILFLCAQKYFIEGMTAGSVKG